MASLRDPERGSAGLTQPLVTLRKDGPRKPEPSTGELKMVIISTAVAVCGSFAFGVGVGYSAPSQFGIMDDLNLSPAQYSVFGSILNIGAMIGAVTSGKISDYLGRKGTMRLASILSTVAWILIYIAQGPALLDFGRFLTGYCCGVFSYVVPVFIAEISTKDLRGGLAAANQLFITIGIAAVYAVGAFVKWRPLILVALIPVLVMLVALFFIPESPRWQAMVGRHAEFEASLQKLRGPDADITVEKAEIRETLVSTHQATLRDLIDRRHIRYVIVGVGLMVSQQFSGINSIIFYADEIFRDAGFSPSAGSIMYSCLQVVVTGIGAAILDKAGRRPLLMVATSGLLIGTILLGTSFYLKEHGLGHGVAPLLAIGGVMVFITGFAIGMGAIPWVLMSELFPLNIKGLAGSLVTLVNWLGSFVVSYTFSYLMHWSSYGTFVLYSVVNALSLVFIFKMVPETKGRTLEDIHGDC